MKISNRAVHMPPSPIRKLVPLADEAKKKGRQVYALNIGQPDLPTPKPFLNALHHYDKATIAYGKSEAGNAASNMPATKTARALRSRNHHRMPSSQGKSGR